MFCQSTAAARTGPTASMLVSTNGSRNGFILEGNFRKNAVVSQFIFSDTETDAEAATLKLHRTPASCSGTMPAFQNIMYSSGAGSHWVYHKNHLVPAPANGFLF